MKEFKFNENYNIIILKRNTGIYEYYLEKVNYSNLVFMFGLNVELNPNSFTKQYVLDFIKAYEKFWKD